MGEVRTTSDNGVREAFFESMKEIHAKYIDADIAPLEINIASRLRRNIQEVFTQSDDEVDITKIMILMEEATTEIVKLMTEAAIRFSLQQDSVEPSSHHTLVVSSSVNAV